MSQDAGGKGFGLRLIGAFKFLSGLLLVGLGIGLFRNAHADPALEVEHLVATLKLDPDNQSIHKAIAWISGIQPSQLRAIGVGTFLYAMIYLVEGVGLLLRKHWAEYFTVTATGLFIPLEIYEVAKRATILRVGILALNLAIVGYLVAQLVGQRRGAARAGSDAEPAPPSSLT